MAQLSLGQFKTEVKEGEVDSWASFRDSFDDLMFESVVIQQLCLENMELFKFKQQLTCERGFDKNNKLEFRVFTQTDYPDVTNPLECCGEGDCNKFKKKEEALSFFYSQRDMLIWGKEINEANKVFDGQRYVLELKDGELTGKRGWT